MDKPIIDQIADVVGKTTLHYEYKEEFKDPLRMAEWIVLKKIEWQNEAIENTFAAASRILRSKKAR